MMPGIHRFLQDIQPGNLL